VVGCLLALFRNKAAVLGLIIIIVNLLAAVFAHSIAPQRRTTQVLEVMPPMWLFDVFLI
jgi:ABC-type antimicrobial peptide transport system permease subunit